MTCKMISKKSSEVGPTITICFTGTGYNLELINEDAPFFSGDIIEVVVRGTCIPALLRTRAILRHF